ncbi:MAG: hypothetical protein IKJ58_04245 [Akkermansia sp.]|nr:hypothetical protein [Akkermansia sp.]
MLTPILIAIFVGSMLTLSTHEHWLTGESKYKVLGWSLAALGIMSGLGLIFLL